MFHRISLTIIWIVFILTSIPQDLIEKTARLQGKEAGEVSASFNLTDVVVLFFQAVASMFTVMPNVFMTITLLILTFGIPVYQKDQDRGY